MKWIILGSTVLFAATSAFAQGTVTFNNRIAVSSHVWGPSTNDPNLRLSGNSSSTLNQPGTDYPRGTNDFPAAGMSLIGVNGTGGQYGAATTMAQLLGAPGVDAPESSLQEPITPATTFRTGSAAGNIVPLVATFSNIADSAPSGTFEMVAWDNSSGLYSTWALASVAWRQGLITAGHSDRFNLQYVGGHFNTPPYLTGLQSFNLSAWPGSVGEASDSMLRRNNDGTMTFTFSGSPGATYLIQTCTGAAEGPWITIATNIPDGGGSGSFTDLDAPNHSNRFYRAVRQ